MAARVLLPLPLGPMMAWTSPALMLRLTPLRIFLFSTPAWRFLISNIGLLIIILKLYLATDGTRIKHRLIYSFIDGSKYPAFKFNFRPAKVDQQTNLYTGGFQFIQ